ncbi:hypothetical protein L9W86_18685, partial [Vibrio aestuarianus]|nr:hypothetical protein [Vibrio aestuarianus]
MSQTKKFACFTVRVDHEFEDKKAHLLTTQNEWPEKSQKIEPLNSPELHNAQLSGEQRTGQAAALHR